MHPGQTLRGTILVKVKQRVKGGIINLSITHKEEVRYTSDDTTHKDKAVVVHATVYLEAMNQQWAEQGIYPLNFQIGLPAHIPATMEFGSHENGCSIEYKIVASMGSLTSEHREVEPPAKHSDSVFN